MKALNWHDDLPAAEEFAELAAYCRGNNAEPDLYGKGAFINGFEEEMAKFLGMESGVFMPSGVIEKMFLKKRLSPLLKIKVVVF